MKEIASILFLENAPNPAGKYPGSWWVMSFDANGLPISDGEKGVGNASFDWDEKDKALKFLSELEEKTGVRHKKLYPKKQLKGKGWLIERIMVVKVEHHLKESGHTWKSYAENIGQNPSNFKRQLVKKVEKLNSWLSPLNLQIQIIPKNNVKQQVRPGGSRGISGAPNGRTTK